MSRRTKLIITAIFLVLLGIPVVYTVLTWSIEPPLSFRCVAALPEEMLQWNSGGPPEPSTPFIIEVRNPSPYPVGFYTMAPRHHAPGGRLPGGYYLNISCRMWELQDKPLPGVSTVHGDFIPPNGVKRFKVLVRARDAALFEMGTVDIGYYWASRVRKMAVDVKEWALPKLPSYFNRGQVNVDPQYGSATLEGVPIKLPDRSPTAPTPSPAFQTPAPP
jgi:hypothetical protein